MSRSEPKPKLFRVALLALSGSLFAVDALGAQASDIRSQAMGGVGVASARPVDAAFANPALSRFRAESWGRSFTAPFALAVARDEAELIDALDEFQATLDDLQSRIDASDPTAAAVRPFLASQLARLDQRALDATADAGVAALYPMRDWTLTISARSYVDGRALPFIDDADITTINDPNSTSADLETLESDAVVLAANVSEFGVTAAYEGAIDGRRFSVGITPKFQWIETYHYAVGVNDFDADTTIDEFRSGTYRTRGSDFNLDLGFAMEIEQGATVGFAVRNLIRDRYETVDTLGRRFRYAIEPRPTLGIAIERVGFQFAFDVDLMQTGRFEEVEESQFVRMGFELDVLGAAQLRSGFSHDLQGTQQNLFSVGLGISPLEALRLDVVGLLGDNALGAGLQLALTL